MPQSFPKPHFALLLPIALLCLGATPWYGFILTPQCPPKQLCIETVVKTSPASKAGLQAKDKITHLNQNRVTTPTDLRKALQAHPSTKPLSLTVRKPKGQLQTVTMSPTQRPSQKALITLEFMGYPTPPLAAQPLAHPQPRALKDARGKFVLLEFWAPWCLPCRVYAPMLDELAQTMPDTLDVWSISEEPIDVLEKEVQARPRKHPVYHDPKGEMHRRLMIREYPVMILLDPKGIVRKVFTGKDQPSQIKTTLSSIMAPKP